MASLHGENDFDTFFRGDMNTDLPGATADANGIGKSDGIIWDGCHQRLIGYDAVDTKWLLFLMMRLLYHYRG